MDLKMVIVMLALMALTLHCDGSKKKPRRTKRTQATCRPNSMVRYRLTLHALWSKTVFPKMFPTYRPHAQWSTLVGRSHGPEFEMWVEGRNASTGVRLFAEQGDMNQLDSASTQGYKQVLDSFSAPPIPQSVGQTSAIIFLDGRHSRISFMMKIIPSPDWFIGVSGLDLCANGRWKDHVEVDLHPMDSGTDRGLTFTSPNWATEPYEPISSITSSFPNHPASSFNYPEYEELPRIAYVELDITSEYRHRQDFLQLPENSLPNGMKHEPQKDGHYQKSQESLTPEQVPTTNAAQMRSTSDAEPKEKTRHPASVFSSMFHVENADTTDRESPAATDAGPSPQNDPTNEDVLVSLPHTSTPDARKTDATESAKKSEAAKSRFTLLEMKMGLGRMGRPSEGRKLNYPGVQDTDSQSSKVFSGSEEKSQVEAVINCEVADWAPWSPCSVSCSFGTQERTRQVVQIPQNGGSNCPLLRENKACGSMRSCNWDYFSTFGSSGVKRKVREGRVRRANLE
ncbi:unnamed protein product [Lymnaea stagnalis]|uniref:Spondin domain-containing protein n=1 Tax=Lymnaea stagnalis TaxID=6523 RepID=A0AAV2I5Q4_LYMST